MYIATRHDRPTSATNTTRTHQAEYPSPQKYNQSPFDLHSTKSSKGDELPSHLKYIPRRGRTLGACMIPRVLRVTVDRHTKSSNGGLSNICLIPAIITTEDRGRFVFTAEFGRGRRCCFAPSLVHFLRVAFVVAAATGTTTANSCSSHSQMSLTVAACCRGRLLPQLEISCRNLIPGTNQ